MVHGCQQPVGVVRCLVARVLVIIWKEPALHLIVIVDASLVPLGVEFVHEEVV